MEETVDIELQLPIGAPRAALAASIDRPLREEDLALVPAAAMSAVRRLTDRHHAAARMVAAGARPAAIAAALSYSVATIYTLKGDPAFRELVEVYRGQEDMQFRTFFERLSGVAADALDLIQERLEDEAERAKITLPQAMEIAKLGADRTGYGPASTTTSNVNVHVGMAEKLASARARAAASAHPPVIEAQPA